MEISITWNICRVCLEEENDNDKDTKAIQHHSIFGDDKLAKNIFDCSGVIMKAKDGMPEKICPKCLKILNYAIYFRKTCRQSDTNLRSVIQRTKSASNVFKQERRNDTLDVVHAVDDPLYEVDVEEDITTAGFNDSEEEDAEHKSESSNQSPRRKGIHQQFQKQKKTKSQNEENNTQLESGYLAIKYENGENNVDAIITIDEGDETEIDEVLEIPEVNLNETIIPEEDNEQPNLEQNEADNELELKRNPSGLEDYNHEASYTKLTSSTQNLVREILEESEEITEDNDCVAVSEIEHMRKEECENNNLKAQNDGLYYILHNIKDDEHSNQQCEVPEDADDTHIVDDNVDFAPIDEDDDMQHIEQHDEDMDDNRSQVTSTVVTKDEIDLEDDSSNLSQNTQDDIDAEFIVDEFIIDDCNSSIEHSSTILHSNKGLNDKNKHFRKSPAISRRHGGTQATSASQHCVCELCGNNFTSRQLMNIHMKIHRQEKAHECELCFKRFITACNLQAHMRIHTGEKPYECKFCSRRFSDRSTHIRHERIHTNEKPFVCNNCGKAFALATTLQAHLRVHTGERPYRCEPCAKSFKLSHQLKAHKSTILHKAVEEQLEQLMTNNNSTQKS